VREGHIPSPAEGHSRGKVLQASWFRRAEQAFLTLAAADRATRSGTSRTLGARWRRQWRQLIAFCAPLTYNYFMIFIETPLFTKVVRGLLPDDSYAALQQVLIYRPDAGDVIAGSGGLRKIRWRVPGSGKRGGLRVIYYWDVSEETIFMLLVYKKSRQEDLTSSQIKTLRNLVKEWLI